MTKQDRQTIISYIDSRIHMLRGYGHEFSSDEQVEYLKVENIIYTRDSDCPEEEEPKLTRQVEITD